MKPDDARAGDRSAGQRPQKPCGEELLSAYVDGELTGAELAEVELLLQQDAEARDRVAELRTLSSFLQSLPRERLNPGLRDQVLSRVKQLRSANDGPQPASPTPFPGSLARAHWRRWLWSGLAIATVLLLMVMQPGQQEAERRVVDVHSRLAKEKAVAKEPARPPLSRLADSTGKAPGNALARLPAAAAGGAGRAERRTAEPMSTVAADGAPRQSLVAAAKESRSGPPGSPYFSHPVGDRSPGPAGAQGGLRARLEPMPAARPVRSKPAASRPTEAALVIEVVLHDPRSSARSFRHWLSAHGMQPLAASNTAGLAVASSARGLKKVAAKKKPEQSLARQAAQDRQQPFSEGVLGGGLVDSVIVEAPLAPLRDLLRACQADPELHVTVGRMSRPGAPLPGRPDRGGADEIGRQHEEVLTQLQTRNDNATPALVRVRFDLRQAVADESSRATSPLPAK